MVGGDGLKGQSGCSSDKFQLSRLFSSTSDVWTVFDLFASQPQFITTTVCRVSLSRHLSLAANVLVTILHPQGRIGRPSAIACTCSGNLGWDRWARSASIPASILLFARTPLVRRDNDEEKILVNYFAPFNGPALKGYTSEVSEDLESLFTGLKKYRRLIKALWEYFKQKLPGYSIPTVDPSAILRLGNIS